MLDEKILKSFGKEFRRCLEQAEKAYEKESPKPKDRRGWIGTYAQDMWVKEFTKQTGIFKGNKKKIISGNVEVEPMSGVSNKGDGRRGEVIATMAGGERAIFELKRSDSGTSRNRWQKTCMVFDLGLGSRDADSYYIIYGLNGRIDAYTRQQGEAMYAEYEATSEASVPRPAKSIQFAPDVTGTEPSESGCEPPR